jgi:formylglycine-generating enzyme required for sulfatase activity
MRSPNHIVTLNTDVTMEFQAIPAGEFRMGSCSGAPGEEPMHLVRIAKPFYLGRVPVTQEQLAVWTSEQTPPDGVHENRLKSQPHNPAENLSWNDALAFCGWLNEARRESLPVGYLATLPTEAEWEYACRVVAIESTAEGPRAVASETEYYTGNGEAALDHAGWFDRNSGYQTHLVGQKAANGVGLHDMHGNVWEWCWDAWDLDAYKTRVDGVTDPGSRAREGWLRDGSASAAVEEGNAGRIIRGGSWYSTARLCRSANRYRRRPAYRHADVGFRVGLVPR